MACVGGASTYQVAQAVGLVLDVPTSYDAFTPTTDDAMASRYHVDVQCHTIAHDLSGHCVCAD
jgi:hypothetical protein